MDSHEVYAKTIIEKLPEIDGGRFWISNSVNPYPGFDSESIYQFGINLRSKNKSEVLTNAVEIFEQEIEAEKPKGITWIGNWEGPEDQYQLSHQLLEVAEANSLPTFVLTRSKSIQESAKVLYALKEKTYVNVAFSVITLPQYQGFNQIRFFDANKAEIHESFKSMRLLAKNEIYTGTVINPIIPFIFDSEENIDMICRATKDAGGKYIYAQYLTFDEAQKHKFFGILQKNFADTMHLYVNLFRNQNQPRKSYIVETMSMVANVAKRHGLDFGMQRYIPKNDQFVQNKQIAEFLFIKSMDLQYQGENQLTIQSYCKAAKVIEHLEYDFQTVYETMGEEGVLKIPHINKTIAEEIQKLIEV